MNVRQSWTLFQHCVLVFMQSKHIFWWLGVYPTLIKTEKKCQRQYSEEEHQCILIDVFLLCIMDTHKQAEPTIFNHENMARRKKFRRSSTSVISKPHDEEICNRQLLSASIEDTSSFSHSIGHTIDMHAFRKEEEEAYSKH